MADDDSSVVRTPRALAFYLPQFHPIPENDAWWGAGFTEWRNVTKARALFPGHYQPHVPADLGYYDLRVPEVREHQASLAREYGLDGFCYYHYWFDGKRLLERPFAEVLKSGQPDFPFALCWANEEWTRNWDATTGRILMPQHHSDADDLNHIQWLLTAFGDSRYIKVDGRPLMLIYRAKKLPNSRRTTDLWRAEAQRAGFPDLFLAKVESHGDFDPPGPAGFDANVGFFPPAADRVVNLHDGFRSHTVLEYDSIAASALKSQGQRYRRLPGVICSWDNTARRRTGATVVAHSSPAAYEAWLRQAAVSVADLPVEERLVFVVAWNEWAEGNHLEPDERYGYEWLEATSRALGRSPDVEVAACAVDDLEQSFPYIYGYDPNSAIGNVVALVRANLAEAGLVVDLGAGAAVISQPLRKLGYRYHGLELDSRALQLLAANGVDATQCDISHVAEIVDVLNERGEVAALLLLDVIEHLTEPEALLAALSEWARLNGSPPLFISVPNVAHADLGIRLLLGRWDPSVTGLLDSTHLRFFTHETLERLCRRCGWHIVESLDFEVVRSDQYAQELVDALPESVVGLLHAVTENYNRFATVQQFVWMLVPEAPASSTPSSFLDAVAREDASVEPVFPAGSERRDATIALESHLRAVGIVSTEANRRLTEQVIELSNAFARARLLTDVDEVLLNDPARREAMSDLVDVLARREDLKEMAGDGDRWLVRLIDWALTAGAASDPDALRLERHRPALSNALAELGLREVLSGIEPLFRELVATGGSRVREAFNRLGSVYVTRPDLQMAFNASGTLDHAALLRWAVSAAPSDEFAAASLGPFGAIFDAALNLASTDRFKIG